MSESNPENQQDAEQGAIPDDQLPEDLQPTDDNPLAQNTEDSDAGGDLEDGEENRA